MRRRTVIIGPPPTPNGDLHVGHLAGPYLGADVHARYLRASRRPVLYATGTDDSQTYVLASARRHGTRPVALCQQSTIDIQHTLAVMGISVDGFAPFDAGYRATVLEFLTALHTAGKFRLRKVPLAYSETTDEFLVEGLVCGDCPVCLAESRGGLCEVCGHPNDFGSLANPRSTVEPGERVAIREAEVLVLPMEDYRPQLTAFYDRQAAHWRPHIAQLVREVLAQPLPDFPITYPISWGIPAPFPETPGQVINAWAEGMPASMYCTYWAAMRQGDSDGGPDELWRVDHDVQLVYFLGFDNAYFWGMTHLALLLAHEGRYVLPDTIVCNEFYELENEKFSTSRGHVVWGRELVAEVPRDLVRFYLALTAPEHQKTNFGRAGLEQVTAARLVEPWNELATLVGDSAARVGNGTRWPVSETAASGIATMIERFRNCYELTGYSLTRAAELIVIQLARLRQRALRFSLDLSPHSEDQFGDLLCEVKALIACASPILIDLAAAAMRVGGFDGVMSAEAIVTPWVTPFPIPVLASATTSAERELIAARS